MENSNERLAIKVSAVSIISNILLSVFKLFAGIYAKSGAMISDAVHSMSDVFSTFIVIIGVKLAGRDSDKGHPYGHERLECVAAIILAVILGATGAGIGYAGLMKIISGNNETLAIPGVLALVAAVISILTKEGMYWYTWHAAKKIDSGALMADAWHHRSDALSSVGSFLGIFGARLGFPILDPIASIIICLFIIKAACSIFADAIGKMTDQSCDDDTIHQIHAIVERQNGVVAVDQIKTRMFGNKIYVDIEVQADGTKTLSEAHNTAHEVHDAIENAFPKVKHCMVHVNPADEGPCSIK